MGNQTLTHLEYCTYCPKMCRHTCPVSEATGRETFIPQNKQQRLSQLRKGKQDYTVETTEPLWACTGCRACVNACVHGVEVGPTLFAGRAEAAKRNVVPPELHRYGERFRSRDERLGSSARELFPKERFATEARVGLWPGCDAIDKGAADVLAQLEVFDRVGAGHVRLVDAQASCGGYPLLAAGLVEAFRWHAGRVAQELSRFGTVVMSCSACVHTLRELYPAEGVSLHAEILHVTEYLAQHVERVPRAPAEPARETVWYHDPCYLARWQKVLEAPRRVLGRVADVKEFAWSHGETECCGGGGVLPKTMPQVADAMARRRLDEVARAGGGTVVTACGTCKHMLARNAPENVIVRDLVEYVESKTRKADTATGAP
jgi:Fe-S oxidoreductase